MVRCYTTSLGNCGLLYLLFLLITLLGWGIACGAEQASDLRVWHQAGQTFITWREVDSPLTHETVSMTELISLRKRLADERIIGYRIYQAAHPIRSVETLDPIAFVSPLSGWNTDYYGLYPKPHQQALRYVVKSGELPVSPGTGIYVHNPAEEGNSYYAVTFVDDGTENIIVSKENALFDPIDERVGQGIPILQRVVNLEEFAYIKNPELHYYVRWEAPPNSSVASRPFDYVVAIPPQMSKPATVGIHMHGWGGNLNRGYGWWFNAEKGAMLIASNQAPYDWWTRYHELFGTGQALSSRQSWNEGVVRAYSQKRLLSFLDWVSTQWEVDLSRTFTAGVSMGGSGSLMLALRFPQQIAWAVSWVGVHIPSQSPQYKASFVKSYGRPEWAVKFEDGSLVWDYFNNALYLRRYPNKEIGFVTFSNGKNDSGIGWAQAVDFYRSLQETKRPHLFVWGQGGHGQRASMPRMGGQRVMPIDIRTDQTIPAFTQCQLDDNPGDGDPADGDPTGQVNLYLYWETTQVVDTTKRWEMTIGLSKTAPRSSTTVNVTPRRCQHFKTVPYDRYSWVNLEFDSNRVIQSGFVVADQWGLITLKDVIVSKNKNRIIIGH